MIVLKKHLNNGQYLTHAYEKTSIFLHHTCGLTAEGAWSWWNETPERVGTPYIVDRNGIIVECFDPKIWAFHLGIKNDDNYHEKHSVNIQLVSGGGLYFDKGEFRFYPLYPNKLYYHVILEEDVCILSEPWKGFKYYHKYSDDQIEKLKELLLALTRDFPTIEVQYPLGNFWEYEPKVISDHMKGLWSHSTVRSDKQDIFPYPPLIQMLEEFSEAMNSKKVPEKPIILSIPKNSNKKSGPRSHSK